MVQLVVGEKQSPMPGCIAERSIKERNNFGARVGRDERNEIDKSFELISHFVPFDLSGL